MDIRTKSIATSVAWLMTINGFGFLGASQMMDPGVVKMMMIAAASADLLLAIVLFAIGLLNKLTDTVEPTR